MTRYFTGVFISYVYSCLLNTVHGSCMAGNNTLCEERGAGCCCDGWRTFGDYCLPPDYKVPTIHKCPHKDHKVLVNVNAINNVAYLRNPGITANDWEGQPLHVSLSKQEFHHCQCSDSLEVVTATAVDKFGQAATCRFWVSIEDYYKPIFENCPNDYSVPYMERVNWIEPTVKDNVGVRELTRPIYNNNTRFSPGTYNLIYSASDWSGNVAECSFKITGLDDEHSMADDQSSVITGSVIGAMFIGLVLMALALLRMCRKRNVLRSILREPIQLTTSVTPNTILHDNPAFTTHDNGLPPYETVTTGKLPEYSPRVNPPSYDDMYQLNDVRGHERDNYCSSQTESPVNEETTSGSLTGRTLIANSSNSQIYVDNITRPGTNQCVNTSCIQTAV